MKRRLRIIWDEEAKRSLKSIYEYIKGRESVHVAVKVRSEIIKQTKTLGKFPEKFERESILKSEPGNFRYKVIWSYKVIYEVTEDAVYILDIFHTSRNPSSIR